MEEYKVCFEKYEISNFGNLRKKLNNGNYKIIQGSILKTGGGYKYFQIIRDGKRINKLFHHLVAYCFIGARNNGLIIDHIDRNPLNNKVENLRYVSQQINCQNTNKYRNDLLEQDKIKRRNILQKERDNKKRRDNGINQRAEKGTGCILKRKDSKTDKWIAQITIDKKKYSKTFNSINEAQQYLNTIKMVI